MGYMYDLLEEADYEIVDEYSGLTLRNDIETILRSIPSYIDILLSQTMMLSQQYKQGQSPKRITAKNVMCLI